MIPSELREKRFSKAFVFGYRVDEVDRYMELIAKSMTDMIEENAALNKKLEVLADKISEYRNDEESLRTALLGAQKLGDSVIRESKGKAAGIMRDANQKAETMVDNAKRQLEREKKSFDNLQKEVENFKNSLFDLYKQHLAIVSGMPGDIKEGNILDRGDSPKLSDAIVPQQAPEKKIENILQTPELSEKQQQEDEKIISEATAKGWSFGQRLNEEILDEDGDEEEEFSPEALNRRVFKDTENIDPPSTRIPNLEFGHGIDEDKFRR